ncbi:MAG: hypothetical protein IJX99_06995 [Clostridia bacterium]|nr:hypothetical protein [Clostridia bacterium]
MAGEAKYRISDSLGNVLHDDVKIEMTTSVQQEGTPLNKALFDSIETDLASTYRNIPKGLICMWSGSEVPIGWLLCNGENNTPDLRDRFIVGAGNEYSIGNTGGEKEHVLTTAEMPKHQHAVGGNNESSTSWDSVTTGKGYGGIAYRHSGDGSFELGADRYSSSGDDTTINYNDWLVNTTSAGSNSAHENRPPYYALAFIMKA